MFLPFDDLSTGQCRKDHFGRKIAILTDEKLLKVKFADILADGISFAFIKV